jgi:hypothetical protein
LKRFLKVLSLACVFALGCYSAVEWPRLRCHAAALLAPMHGFLEAPKLAHRQLAEIQSLHAELRAQQAMAHAREQELAEELLEMRQERDTALLEARQAANRYAALCQAILSLEGAGSPVPALVKE